MDSESVLTSDLLRLVGLMAVGVAVAWAFQILAFAHVGTVFSQLMWVMGAASIAGAGVGLIVTAVRLRQTEVARA